MKPLSPDHYPLSSSNTTSGVLNRWIDCDKFLISYVWKIMVC